MSYDTQTAPAPEADALTTPPETPAYVSPETPAEAQAAISPLEFTRLLIPEGDPRRFNKELLFILAPEEVATLGGRLAELYGQQQALIEEKKAIVREFKRKLAVVEEQIAEVLPKINTRKEMRKVECAWLMREGAGGAPDANLKRLVRLDTGEDVEVAVMSANERQLDLGFMPVTDSVPPEYRAEDITIGGFTGAAVAATEDDEDAEDDDNEAA